MSFGFFDGRLLFLFSREAPKFLLLAAQGLEKKNSTIVRRVLAGPRRVYPANTKTPVSTNKGLIKGGLLWRS